MTEMKPSLGGIGAFPAILLLVFSLQSAAVAYDDAYPIDHNVTPTLQRIYEGGTATLDLQSRDWDYFHGVDDYDLLAFTGWPPEGWTPTGPLQRSLDGWYTQTCTKVFNVPGTYTYPVTADDTPGRDNDDPVTVTVKVEVLDLPPADPPALTTRTPTTAMVQGSIGEALSYADSTNVTLESKVVIASQSGVGAGFFYIEENDRSAGVRVNSTTQVAAGDLVTVSGMLCTTADGERYIDASTVTPISQDGVVPDPLAMGNLAVGGHKLNEYTPGITEDELGQVVDADGPYNKGLLIKTWGRVRAIDPSGLWFYIDDGSGLSDGSGNIGVKIVTTTSTSVSLGDLAVVTGVSSSFKPGDYIRRLVRARAPADIEVRTGETITGSSVIVAPWNFIGLPAVPLNPDPGSDPDPVTVFASIANEDQLHNRLIRWDSDCPRTFPDSYIYYNKESPAEFGNIHAGEGYWINVDSGGTLSYTGVLLETTDRYISLPCEQNWNMIGYPFKNHSLALSSTYVADGYSVKTFYDACQYPGTNWVQSLGYWWDNSAQLLVDIGVPDDAPTTETMQPWHGYWLANHKANIALIVPGEPPAPVEITALPGDAEVCVWWNKCWHSTYRVYRSETSGSGYQSIGETANPHFLDSPLQNGTPYYYVVSCMRNGLEGPKSPEVACTPFAGAPPLVPQGDVRTFGPNGSEAPGASLIWDIVLGGSEVASSAAPAGWLVTYDTGTQKFTLGAPLEAQVAQNYQVRYDKGSGQYASADFHVVPGSPYRVTTVGDALSYETGVYVEVVDRIVTAGTGDFIDAFYVEDDDSAYGIKVSYTGDVSRGDRVDVAGRMSIDDTYKEAYISAETVTILSEGNPIPEVLGMQNPALGGDNLVDPETGVTKPGVNTPAAQGPYNKGLLVKMSGTVTGVYSGEKCFYVDDGVGLDDTTGHGLGVRVSWDWQNAGAENPTIVPPPVDVYVDVAGISSSECINGCASSEIIRVLRPRRQQDIEDVTPPTPGTLSSPTYADSIPISITYSGASDDYSGLNHVELWYKKGINGVWTDSGQTSASESGQFEFSSVDGPGTYYFDLVAEDNAGNRSAAASAEGDDSTIFTAGLDPCSFSAIVIPPDL